MTATDALAATLWQATAGPAMTTAKPRRWRPRGWLDFVPTLTLLRYLSRPQAEARLRDAGDCGTGSVADRAVHASSKSAWACAA
ncbi:hypothetical protein GCM10023194_25200 [Planotetraspora phitsanulokensis]|uniref:Uncharacterized protein n=1 Tax=Planotetraspora phitsanulokensis TaxID=575192 RepID=A0A8J3UBS1_9ACTN|nr:hypothetical protein Pph01_68700 [Planotetraspora phitsanulokensis]